MTPSSNVQRPWETLGISQVSDVQWRFISKRANCSPDVFEASIDEGDAVGTFQSRPITIQAVQWTGDNFDEIEAFGASVQRAWRAGKPAADQRPWELILLAGKDGAQGFVDVPVGHWVLRRDGDRTSHWPVDPGSFAAGHELVRGEQG